MSRTSDQLIGLEVENFRSLRKVSLPLRSLNVLVGPNGAGKTNVLEVFRFLADVIRTDLEPALSERGGFEEVVFWGGARKPRSFRIRLEAAWTRDSTAKHPDEYMLEVVREGRSVSRREEFTFGSARDHRRRILISGDTVNVSGIDRAGHEDPTESTIGIRSTSSGLSTLPRLSEETGGPDVAEVAARLASIRVFDVDVAMARTPARLSRSNAILEDDAGNLAAFLFELRRRDEAAWHQLVEDAKDVLPQLDDIDFTHPSGAAREVIVTLQERGLRRRTELTDASYGTIRLLGLLALLYDPEPPTLTCVEEIDHGLHPQALELLVERLREASERTQFIIATHSPAFADRLKPDELVVCERDDDGASIIPALSTEKIEEITEASEGLPLGELWFSGALGGDL